MGFDAFRFCARYGHLQVDAGFGLHMRLIVIQVLEVI